MINNFRGEGRTYIKGYVRITQAAKARLNEIGVSLRLGRGAPGYEGFFIPGQFSREFIHIPGFPGSAGILGLASEESE